MEKRISGYSNRRWLIGTVENVVFRKSSFSYGIRWDRYSNDIYGGHIAGEIWHVGYRDFQERIKERLGML